MGQSTSSPCLQRQESLQGDEEISERLPTTRNGTVVVDTAKLHQAVKEGRTWLVGKLLQQPGAVAAAAVSAANENGDTCMHVAAKSGHAEIVSLLLHHGAERDRLGSRSRTPLHLASIYGHLEAADVLLAAGADANIVLMDANGYEHVRLFSGGPAHLSLATCCVRTRFAFSLYISRFGRLARQAQGAQIIIPRPGALLAFATVGRQLRCENGAHRRSADVGLARGERQASGNAGIDGTPCKPGVVCLQSAANVLHLST